MTDIPPGLKRPRLVTKRQFWLCVLVGFGLAVTLRLAVGPTIYQYVFPKEFTAPPSRRPPPLGYVTCAFVGPWCLKHDGRWTDTLRTDR
jgi:hypothetical protein